VAKRAKPGKQGALFSDKEIRRDYFKSQQWVEQHVKIKVHITGYATCYEAFSQKPKSEPRPNDSRPQGSLYSQQKHAIADAVEWIRQNSKYKPRIFVATTPGFIDPPEEGRTISKLIDNLKKTYGLQEYVWVRELTKRGYPHYHFVGDIDKFDPVKLSLYWSSLFGVDSKNSIRVGSKPTQGRKRVFCSDSCRVSANRFKKAAAFKLVRWLNGTDDYTAFKLVEAIGTGGVDELALPHGIKYNYWQRTYTGATPDFYQRVSHE